ncbi:MAG: FtsW/RodA/SpoVE family cell cycle protein [Bacteroidales bacterium]
MKEILSKYFKGDRIIWMVIVFLSIVSIVSVYSSIGALAYKKADGSANILIIRHIGFLAFGFLVMYFIHKVPFNLFFSLSNLFLGGAAILLVITFFVGVSHNDATRWLELPGVGIEFQTSDIAKFALIVYIARVLSLCQDDNSNKSLAFYQILVAVLIICGLILPSNFSTAFLLFVTSIIIMFIGRLPSRMLLIFIGLLVLFVAIIFLLAVFLPDILGRSDTWLSRISNIWDNYQANLAKTAISSSGLVGKGPGNSIVRYVLPQASSDFIFAIIIEEWGSIVGVMVLSAYLILLYRTGVIVKSSSRTFPAFLAIGLTVNMVFQALANMAVAVNLVPVTGQPLPLVSWGGTSIVLTFGALGVILSISRSLESEKEVVTEDKGIAAVKQS